MNKELLLKLRGEQAKRERAKRDLMLFSSRVYPGYIQSLHHRYVAKVLEDAINGGCRKIVLHEPPQHGKSLQVSTIFPTFYLGHHPDDPIIITAYNDSHAQSFSRKIRNIIDSVEYENIFPGMSLAKDSKAAHRWELQNHKGSMIAAGLTQGAITGKGAMLLIIDDPYKNREDAESRLYREKCEESYRSTIKTRLHFNAIQVMVMTRWHQGDLANYLIKNEGFQYIKFPALAEKDDILRRKRERPLWKEKFPQSMLLETKESIGLYNWFALYQGEPRPQEGLLFKKHHFQIIDKAPKGLSWVRYWDLATSEKLSADRTASIRACVDEEGNVYMDALIKGHWEWPKVRKSIKDTALIERGALVGIENQGVQKGMVQECWADSELLSVGILGIPSPTSKRIRATPTVARGEAGKLYLVKGFWNEEFIQEHLDFDVGEYDDMVDASSGCMHMLGMGHSGITNLDDLIESTNVDGEPQFYIPDEYEYQDEVISIF